MKKLFLATLAVVTSMGAMATTIGVSNHPFLMKKHIITTEYNNYFSNGSGMGMNIRYLNNINDKMKVDGGFGFTNGKRASRFFAGIDAEIFPDYGRQPRFSVKGTAQTANTDGDRINTFGVSPTISKGFAFWGKEAFPFIALPMKVSLNTDQKVYETSTSVAMGITGRIPVDGIKNLVGNIEANMSLRNSYSSLVMGVSLPIE